MYKPWTISLYRRRVYTFNWKYLYSLSDIIWASVSIFKYISDNDIIDLQLKSSSNCPFTNCLVITWWALQLEVIWTLIYNFSYIFCFLPKSFDSGTHPSSTADALIEPLRWVFAGVNWSLEIHLITLLFMQSLTDDSWICAIDWRSGMADATVCPAAEANLQPGGSGSLRADVQSARPEFVLASRLGTEHRLLQGSEGMDQHPDILTSSKSKIRNQKISKHRQQQHGSKPKTSFQTRGQVCGMLCKPPTTESDVDSDAGRMCIEFRFHLASDLLSQQSWTSQSAKQQRLSLNDATDVLTHTTAHQERRNWNGDWDRDRDIERNRENPQEKETTCCNTRASKTRP